jgi:radical SAM superfamily enzyme YgiQ (UPF0313 family)
MSKKFHAIILTDSISVGTGLRPLGAYSIANELRIHGYNTLVINFITYMKPHVIEELINKFITNETIFVGYSSSLFLNVDTNVDQEFNFLPWDKDFFKKINFLIKEKNSNTQIVFGGANTRRMSHFNLKYKDNLGVDYVIHGYSESMILDFVKKIQTQEKQQTSFSYNKLKEIDYDSKGENFHFRGLRHTWDHDDFIVPGEALPLEVARGCIFKCKFCSYPLLGKHPKDDSYIRLEENIVSEVLENYERYKTLTYLIVDDTFNERTDKIEMMVRVRDKAKLNLNFIGYNRLDLIARKPEQIKLLKDLNFNSSFFGIESMNYESAKSIGKGLRPEEIKDTLYKFKDEFPKTYISAGFIVGLPHENRETLKKWVPWLFEEDCPIDSATFFPLTLVNNTHSQSEFNKDPEKYGYKPGKRLDEWSNNHWSRRECINIAYQINTKLINSGKSKVPGMWVMNLLKLGYDFDTLSSTKLKDLKSKEFQDIIDLKMAALVDDYVKKLMSL